MGLFDKISISRQHSQITLGPAEAFAAIALTAGAADGYATNSEVQAIITALSRMQLFRSYSADVMARMFERILMLLQRQGSYPLLSAALKSLPYELQGTAFAIATDIILADGEITDEEEDFLNELSQALEISEETGVKIIEVMLIKNQG
ncbi:MAG: tellurite resistance TerB family protein [Moorea sp. SIO3I7]|nr:tellurite resistance TerB family protein [Moorena sp. SIO3I7]